MKKFVALTALMLLALTAFAQSPLGAWKGKVSVDPASMPKVEDPQQQAMMKQAMQQVSAMVIKLNVKPNKTFTINIPSFMGQPGVSAEGTWSQKGNVVTMVTTKTNGKAADKKDPQAMKISANGKTMTMEPKGGMGKTKIVFSK